MAETSEAPRLFIEDARRNSRHLRTTWHADGGQFVISTWDGEVCTGAVRVSPEDAARLVGHLAASLAGAVAAPVLHVPPEAPRAGLWVRLRRWLGRTSPETESASVVSMPERDREGRSARRRCG